MKLLRFIAVVLFASAAPLCTRAIAEPLDKAACLNLEVAQKRLLTREMQTALEQGPDWVKDHLETKEIEKVREFLEVEEMIKFRCRGGGVVRSTANTATSPGTADMPPLPDRKPASPQSAVAAGDDTPLPDRKPGSQSSSTADAKPSQTVADSDKTPASKVKATR
jgi:hypothetical protein